MNFNKFFNVKLVILTALSILVTGLSTCAGKVEGPADCPVDCSSAINATANMTIKPMQGFDNITINCQGSVVPKVVELRFLITGGGEKSHSAMPRPGISYEPIFNGSYDPSRNDQQEPRWKGIVTPKDRWCSSECGIAKIELWPRCEAGKSTTHTLSILSGNVSSTPVKITMTDKEQTEGGG